MATKIETPPLSAWVQPSSQALNVPSSGNPQMRRTYKVPTSALKGILTKIVVNTTLGVAESWIAQQAGALVDAGVDSVFTLPSGVDSWLVQSYQIDQKEAGQYMELKIVYSWTDIPFGEISSDNWSEETIVSEGCSWQTYSVSPYIYCNEVDHVDSVVQDINDIPEPSGGNAKRAHIEACYTAAADARVNTSTYVYKNSFKNFVQLTDSEVKIMKKVAAGVNPVFHKPIVYRTFSYKTNNQNNVPSGGTGIDKISTPGITAAGWTGSYIFCGRTFTKSTQTYYTQEHPQGLKIYTMTYTDTWEGALEPDQDFYGDNAWKFHEGPDRQN